MICLGIGIGLLVVLGCCVGFGFWVNHRFFGKRCDDTGLIRYRTLSDYPGLTAQDAAFSSCGLTLRGKFYCYPHAQQKLLVVAHGMYGGHTAYLQEIEFFARRGYLVFAYDNTGTFDSEGNNLVGFSRAVQDLDHALCYLKRLPALKGYSISLFGHSWGGYAVSNVVAYHPDLHGVVAMSGPSSLTSLFCGKLPRPLWFLAPFCVFAEWCKTGKYALLDRKKVWKHSPVPRMVIHGTEDPMISFALNALPVREDCVFLAVPGKYHNPDYTKAAEAYGREVSAGMAQAKDVRAYLAAVDFSKLGVLDEDVLEQAVLFFETLFPRQ